MKYYKPFVFILLIARMQITPANEPVFNQNYIIDTDCATDDFRAINFLLSRPEIKILAFIVSHGTLEPHEGEKKLKSLLLDLNKSYIPVLCNNIKTDVNPPWKVFNSNLKWGNGQDNTRCKDFAATIQAILDTASEKEYTFISLGSLSSVAEMLKNYDDFSVKVRNVVWYNTSVYPREGFNYKCNPDAASYVLDSEKIRVDVISNNGTDDFIFDNNMVNLAGNSETRLAKIIFSFHQQKEAKTKLLQNHFVLRDELVAAYILYPELFDMNIKLPYITTRYNTSFNGVAIKELIGDLITGAYTSERNIVFNAFPAKREMFHYDVRLMMDSAIARHGHEEWKACVITDEFHGHLGIFSIVGAKMGILAREYFQVEHDHLSVVSHAGSKPPYSCLNDGIQVSTGATLGQGTITVASDSITKPEAVFTHDDISIKIKLKDEYLDIINSDIREGIVKFGLTDDGYWKLVRQAALRYWLDWNRNVIFEITTL